MNNQPDWIEYDLGVDDIRSIQEGGCASGAYMPAVTYYKATETMANYGDDVLNYILGAYGELPTLANPVSWGETAVHYLSCAVELYANGFYLEDEV